MASKGYPEHYEKGKKISIGDVKDAYVYHAGTLEKDGGLLTNGGRVLAVTSVAPSISEARNKAYKAVKNVTWEGAFYRTDIALSVPETELVRRVYVEKKDGFDVQAKRLAAACQSGSIKPDELSGSTFTVSNLGSFGVTGFTPVLNAPEVAILGVCGIELKPVRAMTDAIVQVGMDTALNPTSVLV